MGRENMAKLLIENGADINARTNDNKTPCDLASLLGKIQKIRLNFLTIHF